MIPFLKSGTDEVVVAELLAAVTTRTDEPRSEKLAAAVLPGLVLRQSALVLSSLNRSSVTLSPVVSDGILLVLFAENAVKEGSDQSSLMQRHRLGTSSLRGAFERFNVCSGQRDETMNASDGFCFFDGQLHEIENLRANKQPDCKEQPKPKCL